LKKLQSTKNQNKGFPESLEEMGMDVKEDGLSITINQIVINLYLHSDLV